ncbi:hypothetical protein A1Q2_04543 [Trichosporon asahii var. asahii CBS 8904]|uniref:Uncharacterized protein n=1 Tax=Trichosporon asahii var. asahii (strain CBS 8904) TaxID=1220162 RepID=K1VB10_TRIAC|nr:hypothetical protein A1Q2_04543 [Trichosporon asahii var. asahii CBS 8904]
MASIIDDYHPDGPLGNFCLLPFVDEAEANLPPATHIPRHDKKRKARRRNHPEGRESKRRGREPASQSSVPEAPDLSMTSHQDEADRGLVAENDRLNGLVTRLQGQLTGYEQRQKKNTDRIRSLEKALQVQEAISHRHAQELVRRDGEERTISDQKGAGDREQVSKAQQQHGYSRKMQRAQPYDGHVKAEKVTPHLTMSHSDQVSVKIEPDADSPSPSDFDLARLSIHDKHPALETMERTRLSLATCIQDMSALPGQRLTHGDRDYRALCAVHYDVTLQIRQLERLCAKATP